MPPCAACKPRCCSAPRRIWIRSCPAIRISSAPSPSCSPIGGSPTSGPCSATASAWQTCKPRLAVLPLGSGALAGTAFPVDRIALAHSLGFDRPSENSLDAVSDRDFAAEYLFICTLAGVHLSRLAEAVVLFTTAEFGFFELSDAYATGSSLMPQKKNPDVFELARGKSGALIGWLAGLLATLKGLPSAYDKDLQEDKVPVFSATDTLLQLLPVLAGALETLAVKPERMRAAIDACHARHRPGG